MKTEQIPPDDHNMMPQAPEQLSIDFDEAALRARAWELKKENGWTLPYAMTIAEMERKRDQPKRPDEEEKSQ